jgi:hypothetical protein
MSPTSQIVQKLWNYCNLLRDDGMTYGDYVEQLTYLLFLKMGAENGARYSVLSLHLSARARRARGFEEVAAAPSIHQRSVMR